MAISGIGQSYYQNNVATTKSTKSVNSTGETGNTKELSEAEEMAIFKKEFYAEIDKIPRNRTITNVAINISEEAFKNMKDDPEYRQKILSALKCDCHLCIVSFPFKLRPAYTVTGMIISLDCIVILLFLFF